MRNENTPGNALSDRLTYISKDQTDDLLDIGGEQVRYGIFSEPCSSLDFGNYEGYGILIAVNRQTEIYAVSDLSPDKCEVEELVRYCNECRVEPIHLFDVINDFLVGF